MITRKQLLSFWPDVLGFGALVLPFASGISPLKYLLIGFATGWQIWLLAVALLLAIHIAVWQALRVLRGIPTKTERVLAYALSLGSILWPIILTVLWVADSLSGGEPSKDNFGLEGLLSVSIWALIAANALLLRHNLKTAAPAEVSAGVYLVGGYLPNATICLVIFSQGWYSWNVGAYFVLAACIGYVLRIISLMRHGTKAYRLQGKPGVSE